MSWHSAKALRYAPSRGRSRATLMLLVPLLVLAGCAHAGRERGPVFESAGVFRIGTPPAGWVLHRNRRVGRRLLLDYRRPGEDVDLRVTVHPLEGDVRLIPLPALAEAMILNYGRSRGIKSSIDALQRVDFGAHEGLVMHFTRSASEGKKQRRLAQAFIRAGDRIMLVTYVAPPELFDTYANDFAFAMERFAFLLPPDPSAFGVALPSDLPGKVERRSEDDPLPAATPPAP